jgi:hypothetical protein
MKSNVAPILVNEGNQTELRCPFPDCTLSEMCHVTGAKLHTDPNELDRKLLSVEIRCENGHEFVLEIANHAGLSYLRWQKLSGLKSPFAESIPRVSVPDPK